MVFQKIIREEVTVRVPKIGKRSKGTVVDEIGTILIGQQCVLKQHPYLYPKRCEFRLAGKLSELPCARCLLSNKNFPDYLDALREDE